MFACTAEKHPSLPTYIHLGEAVLPLPRPYQGRGRGRGGNRIESLFLGRHYLPLRSVGLRQISRLHAYPLPFAQNYKMNVS